MPKIELMNLPLIELSSSLLRTAGEFVVQKYNLSPTLYWHSCSSLRSKYRISKKRINERSKKTTARTTDLNIFAAIFRRLFVFHGQRSTTNDGIRRPLSSRPRPLTHKNDTQKIDRRTARGAEEEKKEENASDHQSRYCSFDCAPLTFCCFLFHREENVRLGNEREKEHMRREATKREREKARKELKPHSIAHNTSREDQMQTKEKARMSQ